MYKKICKLRLFYFIPVLTYFCLNSFSFAENSKINKALLAKADSSVNNAAEKVRSDPLRPIYHLTTKANWINDPNGPVYFNGNYHMFFQHNPYGDKWGNMSWGHAVSKDLVHWENLPIAIVPDPESYDKDGVFSGCCVINNGIPTIIYTGVDPEVQCIATSNDGMLTWEKYSGNPVISKRPVDNLEGFRDPFVWKENGEWYMVLGSGIKGKFGTALLYSSKDLKSWKFINPLCDGFGKNWECPNFFGLDGKHVLIISPESDVQYSLGDYSNFRFTPGKWRLLDLGGISNFYAPNSMIAPDGRRLLWGWIRGGGTEGSPWNGFLTIPRELTIDDDGNLISKPASEMKKLRKDARHFGKMTLRPDTANPFEKINGKNAEIQIELNAEKTCGIMCLDIFEGAKDKGITVSFDFSDYTLSCGDKKGRISDAPDGKVTLDIFIDSSVIEIYTSGGECLTKRFNPVSPESTGLRFYTERGNVQVERAEIWQMGSIWK